MSSALTVTRGGHVADGAARGDVVVEIGHDDLSRAQDVAVVVAVPVCNSWPSSPTSAAFMVVEPASMPMNTRPV